MAGWVYLIMLCLSFLSYKGFPGNTNFMDIKSEGYNHPTSLGIVDGTSKVFSDYITEEVVGQDREQCLYILVQGDSAPLKAVYDSLTTSLFLLF